jgi:prevent-host-death family protein
MDIFHHRAYLGHRPHKGIVMTAAIVNMQEAKTQLSKLVERACAGEDVVIARAGKPAVRLVPVDLAPQWKRPIGLDEGKIWMSDDFNDPMPDEFTGF